MTRQGTRGRVVPAEDRAGNSFLAVLVTRGRKTRREHAVTLRAVLYEGKYYFSRRRPDSDWFKNALQHETVDIIFGGRKVTGTSRMVTDEGVIRHVSMLKYADESKAAMPRVAIQVTLE